MCWVNAKHYHYEAVTFPLMSRDTRQRDPWKGQDESGQAIDEDAACMFLGNDSVWVRWHTKLQHGEKQQIWHFEGQTLWNGLNEHSWALLPKHKEFTNAVLWLSGVYVVVTLVSCFMVYLEDYLWYHLFPIQKLWGSRGTGYQILIWSGLLWYFLCLKLCADFSLPLEQSPKCSVWSMGRDLTPALI